MGLFVEQILRIGHGYATLRGRGNTFSAQPAHDVANGFSAAIIAAVIAAPPVCPVPTRCNPAAGQACASSHGNTGQPTDRRTASRARCERPGGMVER